jgi:hypothetical protein
MHSTDEEYQEIASPPDQKYSFFVPDEEIRSLDQGVHDLLILGWDTQAFVRKNDALSNVRSEN